MNLRLGAAILGILGINPVLSMAQTPELSVTRLDLLDERGYFTPAFKVAIHDLVNARQALARARANDANAHRELPDLQKQRADLLDRTGRLRAELSLYAHPEDGDFDTLQAAMKNPASTPEDTLPLAQAFVWSYPTDPHQAEVETYLRKIQAQIAAERQGAQTSAAVAVAARAALVERAKARALTLREWRDFLRDMSQEDLLSYLGPPQDREADFWIYSGNWTSDPVTGKRVGLQVNFNGTRVLSVVPASP